MEDEVRKNDEEITRTIKVREKPARKPVDASSLPVEVVDLYLEGTTDGEGRLKDDFIEIGKEESSRSERVAYSGGYPFSISGDIRSLPS